MGPVAAQKMAGGRRVEVAPDRVPGWLTRFADRHGEVTTVATPDEVVVTAADGAVARLQVPFPPLTVDPASPDRGLAAHVLRPRRVGVLLVRLGGHAVGVFDGDRLEVSKVGSRQVHGRSAAGGWSQQRFARRREGQVRVALAAAADLAATLLVPAAASLDAVTGGRSTRSLLTPGWPRSGRWSSRPCSTYPIRAGRCWTRHRPGSTRSGSRSWTRPRMTWAPDLIAQTGDLVPTAGNVAHPAPGCSIASAAVEVREGRT